MVVMVCLNSLERAGAGGVEGIRHEAMREP
jgi:hypothetical protein